MPRQMLIRIGVVVALVLVLGWFFFWQTSRTYQYEVVAPGDYLSRIDAV